MVRLKYFFNALIQNGSLKRVLISTQIMAVKDMTFELSKSSFEFVLVKLELENKEQFCGFWNQITLGHPNKKMAEYLSPDFYCSQYKFGIHCYKLL